MTQSDSIPTYRPGHVVLVRYPFTNLAGARQRPALVFLDSGDHDIVVVRITSQPARDPHDVPLIDWAPAGLLRPSVVRLHKPATVEKLLVNRVLGSFSDADWARVRSAAGTMLSDIFS